LYGHCAWSGTVREEHELSVLERGLGRISGSDVEEVTGRRGECIMRSFIMCTLRQILLGEDEVDRTCNTHGRDEKYTENFGR
jgi:hypothetical protein